MGREFTYHELEIIACATHQANRAYCLAMGDDTQPPWDEAPDWQRESAIEGVNGALKDPNPEASHERWMAHKLADGWKEGPVKDPEAKEHPCLVPYAKLPVWQRLKDDIFINTALQTAQALRGE